MALHKRTCYIRSTGINYTRVRVEKFLRDQPPHCTKNMLLVQMQKGFLTVPFIQSKNMTRTLYDSELHAKNCLQELLDTSHYKGLKIHYGIVVLLTTLHMADLQDTD